MGKTAKTAAERMQLYRSRMKHDNPSYYEAVKLKDKTRKKTARDGLLHKLSKTQLEEKRQKDRIRQQKHRLSKQKAAIESLSSPTPTRSPAYKNRQSLGKAIGKVSRVLPKSPRKVNAVIVKLSERFRVVTPPHVTKKSTGVSELVKQAVKDFYCRDDISRMAPGMKDAVTVREGGVKSRIQKRHLLMTVAEAYALFKTEYCGDKLGKSLFAALRPAHVMLMSDLPCNVCVCRYHDNMAMMLNACSAATVEIPKSSSDFVDSLVCDPNNESCMLTQDCATCGNGALFDIKYPVDAELASEFVSWYRWEFADHKVVKCVKEGTVDELVGQIKNDCNKFLNHIFVKRKQSAYFQSVKNACQEHDESHAVLQVDFSENYSAKYQNEIQSAHWSPNQVTIFTAVAWIGKETLSFCIVSDYMAHDKYAVYVFVNTVIKHVIKLHPSLKQVDVFF